jgi:hypothetical protein
MKTLQLPKTFWWAAGSIVLMLVGAFGPWATVLGVFTIRGTDDNAGWTVVGAAIVAAIALGFFVRWRQRWPCIVPFLAGAVGATVAGYNLSDISSSSDTVFAGVQIEHPAWGIYVALSGSVSLLLASVALGVQDRRHREPDPDSGLDRHGQDPQSLGCLRPRERHPRDLLPVLVLPGQPRVEGLRSR